MSRWRAAARVFWVFFQVGALAIGGPSATSGLVYNRVVTELRWLDDAAFMKVLGLVNMLPGPNALQVAIHVGHRRAGRLGFVLGGAGFMLPGALIAGVLAAVYVRYHTTPPVVSLLYATKPVIIAVTAWATVRMSRSARPRPLRVTVMVLAGVAYLLGFDETLLLATVGALAAAVAYQRRRRTPTPESDSTAAPGGRLGALGIHPLLLFGATRSGGPDLLDLVWVFAKAGALLFGGGMVLLAVLRGELVVDRGWLTEQQLLEAITLGQATPGPVLNTVTFLGYLLAGPVGAVLATVAVLLPSYLFMVVAGPLLRLIDRWPAARAALDGVILAVIGVIGGVTVQLAREAVVDPLTAGLAAAAALVLWRRPQASLWVMAGGAAAGLCHLGASLIW